MSKATNPSGGTSKSRGAKSKTRRSPDASIARVGLRFSPEAKLLVEEAASVLGMTVNAFATAEIVERSREILREAQGLAFDAAARQRFLEMLANPAEPNEALKAAADAYNRGRVSGDEYIIER